MRIATITNWAYGLTLLLTFSSGAAFLAAASADQDERSAVERRIAYLRIADDLERDLDRSTEQAELYVIRKGDADRRLWARDSAQLRIFDASIAGLKKLGAPDAEFTELRNAEAGLHAADAIQKTAIAAVDRGDRAAAREILFGDRYRALDASIEASLHRFKSLLKARTDGDVTQAMVRADRLDDLAKFLLALTAVLFLAVLYFILSRRIAVPLTRMSDVVTRMAEQDFELDMPDDRRRDEIGDVTQALRMFRRNAIERDRLEREQRSDQIVKDRLSRMMHRMQGCETDEEIAQVVACFAPQVFPGLAGQLFTYDPAQGLLSVASVWLDPLHSETDFATSRCWAQRRGHPHRSDANGEDVVCQHLPEITGDDYLCVPLMAQGGTVGLLCFEEKPGGPRLPIVDLYIDIMSENIGMALANIQLRSTLRSLAIRDPLTGLANRRHLDETLNQEMAIAESQSGALACLMIDIDRFKQFNDEFGHDAGDAVMQHVAQVLSMHCREGDVACRYGGEEFAVIMPGANAAVAAIRAEDIRSTISRDSLAYRGRQLPPVTVSIGVAAFPQNADAQGILVIADAALLEAKQTGRNRVVVAGADQPPRVPVRVV